MNAHRTNAPRRRVRSNKSTTLFVEVMEDRTVLSGFGLPTGALLSAVASTTESLTAPAAFVTQAATAAASEASGSAAATTNALNTATAPLTSGLTELLSPVVSPLGSSVVAPLTSALAPVTTAATEVLAPVTQIVSESQLVGAVTDVVNTVTGGGIEVNAVVGLGDLLNVDLGLAVGGSSLLGLTTDATVLGDETGGLLALGLDTQVAGDSLLSLGATVDAVGVLGVSTSVGGDSGLLGVSLGGSTNGTVVSPIDVVIGLPSIPGSGPSAGLPIDSGIGPGAAPVVGGVNAGQQIATPLAAAAAAVGQSATALSINAEEEEVLASLDEETTDSIFDLAAAGDFAFSFAGWDMGGLAARVVPMLLTVDFSAESLGEFTSSLGSLLASATASELSALQSALDSFLADLDVLGGRLGDSAGSIAPWLAVASLAALGASEIVRRDLKRRRTELRRAVAFA